MKIVLDTNVLLVSISSKSKFYNIFEAFLKDEYSLCVTTDILFEYEEILKQHMGKKFSEYVMQLIENSENIEWITRYYKWNLIKEDADDNKFVDCAIACNAKYLVTNDKHFSILKKIDFPKVEIITAENFQEEILKK